MNVVCAFVTAFNHIYFTSFKIAYPEEKRDKKNIK